MGAQLELRGALDAFPTLDGDTHFVDGAQEYDKRRQGFIESFEIKLLRFLNTDVYQNMDEVLERLRREIEMRRKENRHSS